MRMEPVEAKGCTQSLLDRLASLVGQRFQTHVKARVIIQHRQCMGTPAWVDRGPLKSICQRLLGIRARSAASWAWLEDWARSVSMKKRVMVLEAGCAFPSVLSKLRILRAPQRGWRWRRSKTLRSVVFDSFTGLLLGRRD